MNSVEGVEPAMRGDASHVPGRGTRIGGFTVTALISAGQNVSILQARGEDASFVALKLPRTQTGTELVQREARRLQALPLSAAPAPRFRAEGIADGRRYSAADFQSGSEVRTVAAALRERGQRRDVLDLCRRIARAYAALHERGTVHGAVHPRHILEDGGRSVSLLDFSAASAGTDVPPPSWLARSFNTLSPPEHAEAVLRGAHLTLTPEAEQYSVAALLYLLVAGRMYAPLRLTRRSLAEDIIASRPASFPGQGPSAWPALGAVLRTALGKQPADRYPSMEALAQALEALTSDTAASPPARRRPAARPVASPLTEMLESFLRDTHSPETIEALSPPTCSVNFGAAGIAFALTRLGQVTGNAAALDQAERWLAAAERHRSDADAFDNGDELTPETVGPISPYHTASGLAVVRALLGAARGDTGRQQKAMDDFRTLTAAPCANLDLTLGRSSVLLSAALVYGAAQREWQATERLGDYGDRLCTEIWRDLPEWLPYYGIAHGWAGIAFATLMWTRTRGSHPPDNVRSVLEMLAAAAEPWERGLRWALSPADGPVPDQFWPGWCHGNAGYVFLWNLARAVYGEDRFATLAERAACLIDGSPGFTSLCCGSAGQVYALLNQYRSSGEERWRGNAVRLATDAAISDALADDATSPLCLYKGHVGLALLAAELEHPERAAMPLFESELRP